MQKPSKTVVEFMSQLGALAKSCNFGNYLLTALQDQFVCGLKDLKCQQELLSILDLTVEIAQRKAQAAEVVALETKSIKLSRTEESKIQGEEISMLRVTCYRCRKEGHKASDCRHRNTKCHACHKTRHLASVCRSRLQKTTEKKGGKRKPRRRVNVHIVDEHNSTDPSSDDQLYAIFQVGGKSPKMMVMFGVPIDMEVDTEAACSTIPAALFKDKLVTVCNLQPSQVTLRQYD